MTEQILQKRYVNGCTIDQGIIFSVAQLTSDHSGMKMVWLQQQEASGV